MISVGVEGEVSLVEHDMARDENTTGGSIETPVPLVIGRVAKECVGDGARGKFVGRRGCDVGIAQTAEYAKVSVVGVYVEQEVERGMAMAGTTWSAIKEKSGCVKRLRPVGVQHGCMDKKGANNIIERA